MSDSMRLIAMPGTETFASKVDYYLRKWHNDSKTSFIMPVEFPRFATGDAKVVLKESIRGKDVFIISDPNNYSVTYRMHGYENRMSPDDHFQDIKRVLSAINGKTDNISLLMTMLYGSRQHGRNMRESLDCAFALRELENAGVRNIVTFDAHDPKIQNATPLMSFDNLYPNYQMVKALVRQVSDIDLRPEATVVISPDAGGVQRCLKYAEALGLDIGMFYKQRDTQHVVGGSNPIEKHEFIGQDLHGKDVIIVDDILLTGDSLIDSFRVLKERGARRIFSCITFGLFTKGYQQFDQAHADGMFDKIFITDLTYHEVENNQERPYIENVELSKYAAYIIDCIFKQRSISEVVDPYNKIRELLNTLHVNP